MLGYAGRDGNNSKRSVHMDIEPHVGNVQARKSKGRAVTLLVVLLQSIDNTGE